MLMKFMHGWVRPLLTVIFAIIGPAKVYGRENVPMEGAVLLAANHASYMDPPLVGWKSPRYLHYMAKANLFKLPILGPAIRACGAFPVDRRGGARAAIRASIEVLKSGEALLIFPEGTRTRGAIRTPLAGIAMIVEKTRVPVVPVLLTGTYRSFSPDHPFVHRGPITVTFGKPIELPSARTGEEMQANAQTVMDAIEALRAVTPSAPPALREEDLPPEKPEKPEKVAAP